MIDPFSQPQMFDYFTLAGQISPGVCKFKASKKYKWDAPDQKATSGSDPTYQGIATEPFTVTIQMWSTPHWHTWELFKPLLDYADDAKPQAYDFFHPYADMVGINAVTVDGYTTPENDGKGLRSIDITFRPFKRPKDAGGKVSGTASNIAPPGSTSSSSSTFGGDFLQNVRDADLGRTENADDGFNSTQWDASGQAPQHPSHDDTTRALKEAQP